MKRIMLLSLCLVLVASMAFAQGGRVGLFSDVGATNCNYTDTAPGLVPLYIVHVSDGVSNAAQGASFKVELGAGVTASIAGSLPNYQLVIGDPATGVAVTYGVCAALPTLLFTLNMFNSGTSAPCSYISIVAYPVTGTLDVLACSSIEYHYPAGGQAIVNSDGSCDCDVPNDEATWGKIKALYSAAD